MATGYEVRMYRDVSVIANSLHRLAKLAEYGALTSARDLLTDGQQKALDRLKVELWAGGREA